MAKSRPELAEEDRLRADLYAMLGRLLSAAPGQDLIDECAGLSGDDSALGQGITALARVASQSKAKGVAPSEIIVCVLDRPRHADLIAELRAIGCGVVLIGDGDVAGVIAVTDEDTTIDMYMGQGGAPEGVLAAAALRCVGGQFNGRLVFRNDDEKARARKWGIADKDFDRIYTRDDLVKGDCIFAATGVTSGSLLDGVKYRRDGKMTTESVVMRASSGTVRWVRGEHRVK